ncbi:hypothetical protein AB0C38_45655 [Amycolatopsis sp. NPDC048633]|uniref:hypothetical protein n=1 Tax=Amycolatopsis sp. NPDC048633 TaxID=3157095 RepID=UPI0033C71FBD
MPDDLRSERPAQRQRTPAAAGPCRRPARPAAAAELCARDHARLEHPAHTFAGRAQPPLSPPAVGVAGPRKVSPWSSGT